MSQATLHNETHDQAVNRLKKRLRDDAADRREGNARRALTGEKITGDEPDAGTQTPVECAVGICPWRTRKYHTQYWIGFDIYIVSLHDTMAEAEAHAKKLIDIGQVDSITGI